MVAAHCEAPRNGSLVRVIRVCGYVHIETQRPLGAMRPEKGLKGDFFSRTQKTVFKTKTLSESTAREHQTVLAHMWHSACLLAWQARSRRTNSSVVMAFD